MGSSYYLGWPGLESAPIHIVDVKTHKIYNAKNKLPKKLKSLNKMENRYIELSWIVNRFPLSQQQTALNILMKLVGDLNLAKFYVGPNNVAYVPLDTVVTFVICHPHNPAFTIARCAVIAYLQNYLEMPCKTCGFIIRECQCAALHPELRNISRDNIIGLATDITSSGIQCDLIPGPLYDPSKGSKDSSKIVVLPPHGNHPVGARGPHPDMSLFPPNMRPGEMPPYPWAGMRPQYHPYPPPPLPPPPPPKPKMRDIGIQTRAVFDFNRKKRTTKKEREEEAIMQAQKAAAAAAEQGLPSQEGSPSAEGQKTSDGAEKTPENGKVSKAGEETKDGETPSTSAVVGEGSNTVVKPAIKVSLWKLIDSDDDSDLEEEKKEEEKQSKSESSASDEITGNQDKKPTGDKNDSNEAVVNGQGTIEEKKIEEKTPAVDKQEDSGIDSSAEKAMETDNNEKTEPVRTDKDSPVKNIASSEQKLTNDTEIDQALASEGHNAQDTINSETSATPVENEPMETDSSQQTVTNDNEGESTRINENTNENVAKDVDAAASQHSAPKTPVTPVKDQLPEDSANQVDKIMKEIKEVLGLQTPEKVPKSDTESHTDLDKKSPESGRDEESSKSVLDSSATDTAKENSTLESSADDSVKATEGMIICEKTGKLIKEGESPPAENIVIPPSPPPQKPLSPLPIKDSNANEEKSADKEESKEADLKKDKVFKKWYQRFEYTPTGEKIYRCTFTRCGQCFDSKCAAELHNKAHGAFGQENHTHLTCWECNYTTTYSKWYDMLRHLRVKHNIVANAANFACQFCGLNFDSEEQLSYHINFHYLGRYKCIYCGQQQMTWKQVQNHVKECTEAEAKREKKLGCPYCAFVFHIKNMRNIHMLSHIDEGLVCIFCDNNELWENWKQLRKHYQQKHGRKVTSSMNPLKPTKMEIKKNPKCHVCETEFKVFEDFVYHMRKKHDFVPYVQIDCEYCEKMFRTQKAYDWHMKNTHGEDVKCDKCDFVGSSKQMLKAHMTKNHAEKQHVCTECERAFKYYHQLKVHMVQHARRTMYRCTTCDAEFGKQFDLRQHQYKEHPIAPNKHIEICPECDHRCSSKSTLHNHMKRHHPEYEDATIHAPPTPEPQAGESHDDGPDHDYYTSDNPLTIPTTSPAPPPVPKIRLGPKHKKTYYKGGRRGRGRGRGRGRAALTTAKPYVKKEPGERRPGRSPHIMPKISVDLENLPSTATGAPLDRDDKKKIKRLLKEKEARIRYIQKSCCARSISYQDHMAMKAIDSSTQFSPIANFELGEGEPGFKRRRLSSTSYSRQSSYASTSSQQPYTTQLSQSYARQSSYGGAYGPIVALPTEVPESPDLLPYPFVDHCYFKIESHYPGHEMTMPHEDRELPSGPTIRGVYKPTSWGGSGFGPGDVDIMSGTDGGEFGEAHSSGYTSTTISNPGRGFGPFSGPSFAGPPVPSRQKDRHDQPNIIRKPGKRGRKPGTKNSRPYGSGKFVPLAPATGERNPALPGSEFHIPGVGMLNPVDTSDSVPITGDQFGDGEVAMEHEVAADGAGMEFSRGEEMLPPTPPAGVDLMKPPAAEDLMNMEEDMQQDSLLRDIISQLEARTQQPGNQPPIPQSPLTNALMRSLMQSPPTSKARSRRLSLSGDLGTTPPGMTPLSNTAGLPSTLFDAPESGQPTASASSSDCMVTVVSSQASMPTDSIATVLPGNQNSTAPSAGASDQIDENTLNEVYQLLGSNFGSVDSIEELQKKIAGAGDGGMPATSQDNVMESTQEADQQIETISAQDDLQGSVLSLPESNTSHQQLTTATQQSKVLYTTRHKVPLGPSPGSTAKYRTISMQKPQPPSKVIYQQQNKAVLIPKSGISSSGQRVTIMGGKAVEARPIDRTDTAELIESPEVSTQSRITFRTSTSLAEGSQTVTPASTPTAPSPTADLTPSTTPTSLPATSSAGSGRIPVRIKLAGSGNTTGNQPIRIKLPSGTSLGQNVTKISLQQLLKSGATIKTLPSTFTNQPSDIKGIQSVVPDGEHKNTVRIISSTSQQPGQPKIIKIPSAQSQSSVSNLKIGGKNVIPISSLKGGQLPAGARVVRVSKGGQMITSQLQQQPPQSVQVHHVRSASPAQAVASIPLPVAEEQGVHDPADFVNSIEASSTLESVEEQQEQGGVQYRQSGDLIDALPTDEEIAKNIVSGGSAEIIGEEDMDML